MQDARSSPSQKSSDRVESLYNLCVLTAALQELTPRALRDADQDLAIEEWLQFAAELEGRNIQLSAALHQGVSSLPAEALLDPIANTLDLREPPETGRTQRVLSCMQATGVGPRSAPSEARFHAARF